MRHQRRRSKEQESRPTFIILHNLLEEVKGRWFSKKSLTSFLRDSLNLSSEVVSVLSLQ